MSVALNDDNVKGGNVIKPFAREIGTGQKFVSLLQIKVMSQKTMDMSFMHVKCLF